MIDEELIISCFKQWKSKVVAMMRSENKYLDAYGTSILFDKIIKIIERISVEKIT